VSEGRERALGTAIDRALNGERTPVFYRGRQIGERVRYNDSLLLAALRAVDPRARGVPSAFGSPMFGDDVPLPSLPSARHPP
jgi:hypothetical protein